MDDQFIEGFKLFIGNYWEIWSIDKIHR